MAFKILTVCTGNICRSPSAEVVLRHHLAAAGLGDLVEIDSAGTADFHIGEPPSERAIRIGAARGYDLTPLKARQVCPRDFTDFDLILAMDGSHMRRLKALLPADSGCRIHLFLEVLPEAGIDVADPFYGDDSDYVTMLNVIEAAVPAWVARIQEELTAKA